jgi:hypothetical protein
MATRSQKKTTNLVQKKLQSISSRLDIILTNLPITNPTNFSKITIFDHAWVQTSFGKKRERTHPSMKDNVLGSEEFIIHYYRLLEEQLTTCPYER